jgi:lycopene cyclase CruP
MYKDTTLSSLSENWGSFHRIDWEIKIAFPSMKLTESVLLQMPDDAIAQLERIDRFWSAYRSGNQPTPAAVQQSTESLNELDCDVLVCGGTLGIFIGCALAVRGWRVTVLEQGILRGREQEWNISRQELDAFLELELLTPEELETAIATEYNPGRVGFLGGEELWVRDVLNIGIDPVFLLATLKRKFLASGGTLLENTGFKQAVVHPNGVCVEAVQQGEAIEIKARLLLDVMGHFSAIARQARIDTNQGQKPDGVCMVVGSCAQGLTQQEFGDLIVTFTPIQNQCQYFWEAFPARDGRTTYMFAYADADPQRPSFSELWEEYLSLLPQYQNVELRELKFLRTLFGFFPSYRSSPLQTAWDRIVQVGDSSGSQSPLSFGGFGALVRHLVRLTDGIEAALTSNSLDRNALRLLQPYQPSLSVTWLFQKAMSVGINQKIEPDRINYMLSIVFQCMQQLGDPVLKPFLQDVVQFPALSQTMLKMAIAYPVLVRKVIQQVGAIALLDWMQHYVNLGAYSLLDRFGNALNPILSNLIPEQQYLWQCLLNSWKYGSGRDYDDRDRN